MLGQEKKTEKAIDLIKKDLQTPFFLWIHYMDPHMPYAPPAKFLKKRGEEQDLIDMLKLWYKISYNQSSISKKELEKIKDYYRKELSYLDQEIGRLKREMEEKGVVEKNTLLILTADHGEEFMEHGEIGHNKKLYEEVLHVPLIISDKNLGKEKTINDPVGLIDILPTILDLNEIETPPELQGESLIPLIKGKDRNKKMVKSEALIDNGEIYSIRTKKWRYIKKVIATGRNKEELYNLEKDPNQAKNIIKEKHSTAKRLRKEIENHIKTQKELREKQREKERIKRGISKIDL